MHPIYRYLRAAQAQLPDLRRLKFGAYNLGTRWFGRPAEPEFKLLTRMPALGTAFDVGANWGQSIESLRRFSRPKKIISIEPNPELSKLLARKYAGSPTVEIENVALSDREGELILYVPSYNGFVFDGLASLSLSEARDWLREDRVANFNPSKVRIDRHTVRVRTLDSFGMQIDFLKIDVQGFELQVVKGGMETLARDRPITIIETPSEEIMSMLRDLGLHPYTCLNEGLYPGKIGEPINIIFLTDEHYGSFQKLSSG